MKTSADTRFSPSDAALEGFQVLRRHWRVVAGWAGFNLMALVAMVVVTVILIVLGVAIAGMAGGGRDAASQTGGAIGGTVGFFGTLFIEVSMVTALFRLLLREGQPGFFYLRWGPDEVRLLAVWVCKMSIAGVAAFAVVGLAAAGAKTSGWAAWLVSVIGAALGVWVMTRLSLAGPVTFAQRRFGLGDAWRMSRGRFWPLLGMNALALCLLVMVAVVAWLALFLLMAGLSGFHDWGVMSLSDREALTDHPLRYVVQLTAEAAFFPVLLVIMQAPLAAAYIALSRDPGPWDLAPKP